MNVDVGRLLRRLMRDKEVRRCVVDLIMEGLRDARKQRREQKTAARACDAGIRHAGQAWRKRPMNRAELRRCLGLNVAPPDEIMDVYRDSFTRIKKLQPP